MLFKDYIHRTGGSMKQKGISEIFVKLNIELIRNVHFLKKNLYDARLLLSKEKKKRPTSSHIQVSR